VSVVTYAQNLGLIFSDLWEQLQLVDLLLRPISRREIVFQRVRRIDLELHSSSDTCTVTIVLRVFSAVLVLFTSNKTYQSDRGGVLTVDLA
jgi:hypothetical protein